MSRWSRLVRSFRPDQLHRDVDEELESHIAEAVESGRDPGEARRAFGSVLRNREESHDVRVFRWLDSLRADAVFGWRQLRKHKVTSAAAILSLGLGVGACTAAFRLIDALLLRPMPIAEPGRLYAMSSAGTGPSGAFRITDSNEYPQFQTMRAAVKEQAEMIAVSGVDRIDLTYRSDEEMEKAYQQYVSGWMFGAFGLKPALGRLFTESDDDKPGAHPYAVLSYEYWMRRFGKDPGVLGRTFREGNNLYEIIGVAPKSFTGTEPGIFADLFLPTMMYAGVTHDDWSWIRTLVQLKPGVNPEPVRDQLQAVFNRVQHERAKKFFGWPQRRLENFLKQRILVEPAAGGVSEMRSTYRRTLMLLALLVGVVLLIACANVANLLSAQAAARAREMALRVSIGAGRGRLVQLVLVESGLLATLAALVGGLFAWWSAPFVVARINPPDNPVRLDLPADWRVFAFSLILIVVVTVLFGLLPSQRASSVRPATALKGGDDPHARGRLMHLLVAIQAAFCCVVLFVAGLLVATFDRISHQATGFSAERLLVLDTVTQPPQSPVFWDQVADHVRGLPGVESVALSGWTLLSGIGSNGFVSVDGAPPHELLAYFLNVSPGWLNTMKISLLDGRDFRPDDTAPGAAIINEAFAKEYFPEGHSIGRSFNRGRQRFEVVGVVRDARYRNMREPITPTAYIPFRYGGAETVRGAALLVRVSSPNPMDSAGMLRREVSRARSEFRVSNIRTQQEINDTQTVRERLLAMLAVFFAGVALLLAGVGMYGVLDYSVVQRRREIGIRMAIGAPVGDIARRVTVGIFGSVLFGSAAGLAFGLMSKRLLDTLLYQVKATDLSMLVFPLVTVGAAATLAALPGVIRAVRINPSTTLRSE